MIVKLQKKALVKYGYNLIVSNSLENAMETVGKMREIDLILMDIDLSRGTDGSQAAEIILKDRDIPVVFLSSHTESDVVEKTEKDYSFFVDVSVFSTVLVNDFGQKYAIATTESE